MTPISATTNRTGKGQVEAGLSHSPKLQPWHLDRLAVVYVRQSSPQQVAENRESTDRQYGVPIATEKKQRSSRAMVLPNDGSLESSCLYVSVPRFCGISIPITVLEWVFSNQGPVDGFREAILRKSHCRKASSLFFSRMANLTGEAQESTNFYGKRSHLLAVFATK